MFGRFLLLCFLLGVNSSLVTAHHSVAGQFDMNKTREWTGVIVDVDWINPHSYVYLEVTEDDGSVSTWRLETLPTAMFRKAGISQAMLRGDGQQVTIEGLPARDGTENLGYILRITYEDGHFYQLSNQH